jgi:hypothetical protein
MPHLRLALILLLLLAQPRPAHAFFSIMSRLFMGKPRRPYTGVAKAYDALRDTCALTAACAQLPRGMEQNCVLRCLSASCWAREYAAQPLEPGEIDAPARTKRFNKCLIATEGRLMKVPGLWPPQLHPVTGTVVEALEDRDEFGELAGAGVDAGAGAGAAEL